MVEGEFKVGNSKLVFSAEDKKQKDDDWKWIYQLTLVHKGKSLG